MIPFQLTVSLLIGVLIYFAVILFLLKYKAISLKYTLLWIFAGVIMALLVLFPEILVAVIHVIGITSNMNGLFVMGIGFIIMILMSLTSIVSGQNRKIRVLIQNIALLEERIRELEKNNKAEDKEAE